MVSYFVFLLIPFVQAAPLSKKIVDMTYTFDETTLHWPGNTPFQMHGVINRTFPGGYWLQVEEITSATHVGTHMDAPAHFLKGGLTIDKIPPSNLMAPAAVVDIASRAELDPDAEATVEDLLQWESSTGQTLNGTILLLRTGWGRKWNNQNAYYGVTEDDPHTLHYPGLAGDAAQWLVDNRNIVGLGIDTLSFDRGVEQDYVAHRILLGHGIFGLENVANMDEIPIYGATLYVMPMKVGNSSGAPTRIFAIFPFVKYRL